MVKYGILGCGKHALQSHAIPGKGIMELAAICDISEAQLESFERAYGGKLEKFTDKGKFLSSGIDAVLISTPDECHYRELELAVGAGLHVFAEKPLATASGEVGRLKDLLDSNKGLVISSCHSRRYAPSVVWLKENLPALIAELGNPVEFSFEFSYHKPTKSWKHSRGLLLDHLNHEIDLCHHLLGYKPFEAARLADSFDYYSVVGKREDLLFRFSGTRRLEARNYMEFLGMRFDRGVLQMNTLNGLAEIHNHERNLVRRLVIPQTDYLERVKKTMVNFVQAVNGVEPCYLTRKDLYVNTAMCVMLTENESWKYELA